nr:MAG TPA: hypothetical protein [Caudoviricetes sp.]
MRWLLASVLHISSFLPGAAFAAPLVYPRTSRLRACGRYF